MASFHLTGKSINIKNKKNKSAPILNHKNLKIFHPFQGNVPFLYPLKTSKNQRFSDVFREYRNKKLAWNELPNEFTFITGILRSQSLDYTKTFLILNFSLRLVLLQKMSWWPFVMTRRTLWRPSTEVLRDRPCCLW